MSDPYAAIAVRADRDPYAAIATPVRPAPQRRQTSQDRAATMAKRRAANTEPEQRAILQGFTMGFQDDMAAKAARLQTMGSNALSRVQGKPIPYTSREAEAAVANAERGAQRNFASQRPVSNALLQLGGGALLPGGGYIRAGAGLGGTVGRAALVGGGYGAAAGAGYAEGGIKNRIGGAVRGGVIGAGAGAALQGGSNALIRQATRARVAPPSNQRRLANENINLTPGQMAGGVAQRAEDAATSVPILGDAIRGARIRGLEDFDRAAINRTLTPINGALAPAANVGREGVDAATGAISQHYDTTLQGVTVMPDAQRGQDLDAIMMTPNLPPQVHQDLRAIVENIRARLAGPIDGRTWKQMDSEIGAMVRAADSASGQAPVARYLRDALQDIRTAHRGALERANPAVMAAVRQGDEATANLARVRQAAQYTGTSAREGVFSPADLNRAVQGMDTSAGNRQFATGQALMQDLTDPAMAVLPQRVPDSGTPFRSLMSMAGLSGGGVAVGANPAAVGGALGGVAAASGLYSRPVIDIMNRIYRASAPGQARQALAELGQLAARDPALTPAYEAAAAELGVLPQRAGDPQATR